MPVSHEELLAAVREVNRLHNLGDAIYDVRSRVDLSSLPAGFSSWDHVDVVAYSKAVDVINKALT